ncbi:Gram domain containing protein [Pleurostoma richardsiae]|uniref:Gram domain containing protein n=1 Tax=Pleurostoma richardsiae TaxID=41990 RepID=A0AA38VJI1_9PEZI|nr:Gram domain containing protein [Pleurostoma richardsiae]
MDGNGLQKLLKRRKKKQSNATTDWSSDDVPRGRRSATSRAGTESDDAYSQNVPDDEEPSQASYDSDPESSAAHRPTAISSHPSQIGYLTTNSPLVQAEHVQNQQYSESQSSEPSLKSATSAAEAPDLIDSAPPSTSRTALVPPSSDTKRSASPVGRFREAFRSKKSSTSSTGTGSPSPERRPSTSGSKQPPVDARKDVDDTAKPDLKPPLEDTASTSSKATSSTRFRSLSRGQKIDTNPAPPRTPPGAEQPTPVIVNTPPTPTDPSHPTFRSNGARNAPINAASSPATSTINSSPSSSMIAQRRGRAASASLGPSKLSNITLAPLTPTPESGTSTPSNPASGFFTSMISAAQNAANTLSNSITSSNISSGGSSRNRTPVPREPEDHEEDSVEVEPSAEASTDSQMESKEPAIKTLGLGDLSLSQLGVAEQNGNSRAATPTMPRFPERSQSRARSESAPVEPNPLPANVDVPLDDSLVRPLSLYEPGTGDKSPPTGSVYEGKSSVRRSGSIRSAIGRHRKRGSSAATGGTSGTGMTIGAAIAAANASVAHPAAHLGAPKLTGFAVASKKRNRDFHALFKSVPDDDYLIEDYSCALQREILAHGRLYVSEGHLCFSSNILGWSTTLVMSFDEIVSVEKRSTALVFKNGLMISTLHAKHIFASFTSRDSTYDLIVKIWKLGHPGLQSSLNGVKLDETGGDKTEKVEAESILGGSRSASDSEEEESEDGEDIYDEDEENDDVQDTTQSVETASVEVDAEKAVARKASGAVTSNGATAEKPKENPAATPGDDFPGPATHAPTDCGDADTHYEKVVGDDVIPAPLGKVYSLLFGPASPSWMGKWLTNDQKCTELQMEDKQGLTKDNKTRTITYIKPLNASIGPRQTKCIVTEQLDNIDMEKSVNLTATTQTPDVPSGNIFSVKTKYCLTWAENNGTRVQVNCTIEWTGKSWLKGPIEKGANDGQAQYSKDLFASLKAAVTSRPRSTTLTNIAPLKVKKKGRKGKAAQVSNPASDEEAAAKPSVRKDWGLFEPVHGLLGPVLDLVKPLLTGNVVYGLLVGLLVATWFGSGFTPRQAARGYGQEVGFPSYPDRIAAYEEMWRREESELWDWLEERAGLDRLGGSAPPTRKKVAEPRTVEEKLREERMDEREIREAIKVTEEKLKVLKSVMDKKHEQQQQPKQEA